MTSSASLASALSSAIGSMISSSCGSIGSLAATVAAAGICTGPGMAIFGLMTSSQSADHGSVV